MGYTHIQVPVSMLRRLLRLARQTAENLEADKHRDQHELVEVQLLRQVERVEDIVPSVRGKSAR